MNFHNASPKSGKSQLYTGVYTLSIGSRLPQLLGGPGVGRRSWRFVDTHMDDFTRLHIDHEEGKQREKEEVCDLQAHHTPRCLAHGSAGKWPSSVLAVLAYEYASCTSEWCFGDADAQLE